MSNYMEGSSNRAVASINVVERLAACRTGEGTAIVTTSASNGSFGGTMGLLMTGYQLESGMS